MWEIIVGLLVNFTDELFRAITRLCGSHIKREREALKDTCLTMMAVLFGALAVVLLAREGGKPVGGDPDTKYIHTYLVLNR